MACALALAPHQPRTRRHVAMGAAFWPEGSMRNEGTSIWERSCVLHEDQQHL
jgi:hypothetical protein